MKVSDIIKEVRWRIDEESNNISDLAEVTDEKDDSYMDNIIEANIPDALHWIAITATSSSALSGSTTTTKKNEDSSTESKKESVSSTASTTTTIQVESYEDSEDIGVITMPESVSVFNINRVRGKGWHKAVVPVEDTDDEALMMFDDTAKGTFDRPLAAIMRVNPLKVLIQPKPSDDGSVTISYVGVPTDLTTSDGEEKTVEISDTFKGAFIHYLAFLLLSAYNDTKASQMYTIALQQLGVSQTSK